MIPIEVLGGWGVTGAIIIGHVFVANYRINQNAAEIKDFWGWKYAHEKDVADKRLDLQKELGRLESRADVHDGNYTQILDMLKEIKSDIRDIKNKGD